MSVAPRARRLSALSLTILSVIALLLPTALRAEAPGLLRVHVRGGPVLLRYQPLAGGPVLEQACASTPCDRQLPPGSYQVTAWSLANGSFIATVPEDAEVVAGATTTCVLGRPMI